MYLLLQVLSTSVANALAYFDDPETNETQLFVRKFDSLFDCLNVRSVSEWYKSKKEFLKPYKSPDDPRLKVNHDVLCPNGIAHNEHLTVAGGGLSQVY